MHIDYTGRGYDLDDQIRDFAAKKLAKLARFIDEPATVHLVLETEKIRQIAELTVSHRHGTLQATEASGDMRDSVFAVISKVEKQARRSRKKFYDRRRRAQRQVDAGHHWPMQVLEGETVTEGEQPNVIKRVNLPVKPMSLDAASDALAGAKNDFVVFLDPESGKVNVLYRRKDGNLGLIAPEL